MKIILDQLLSLRGADRARGSHICSGQYKTRTANCGLRTTDCGLGIKYGLGIKRGLENTDWV